VEPPPVRTAGHWALPHGGPLLEGGGEYGGYDPQDLQSAYKIPHGASESERQEEESQTVAVVDAYGYLRAESDLAEYRKKYGLEPCTATANGGNGCFKKVNEQGEEGNYPELGPEGWRVETGLDLDMVSAACPHCHILLVQANDETAANLGESVNTAAKLGATEISNSYGGAEQEGWCGSTGCTQYNADFHHEGVMIFASAGDGCYDNRCEGLDSPLFPATSPDVTAVGGTALRKASGARGWSEEVWYEPGRGLGTGSGCSLFQPKPAWQSDTGCTHRTDDDVAAVGACETPVSIYVTIVGGFENVCGTSASSPLVAAIEAHASTYARSLPGAEAFYLDPAAFFDVTTGRDGECTPPAEDEYLCHAEVGYDGPTGNGAPNGPLTLESAPPAVATRSASAVTGTTATLNGAIVPNRFATTYQFEYGTTTSYGTKVPVPAAPVGSGAAEANVVQALTGLQPGTVYHYRLTATNSAGTSEGTDIAFKTAVPTVTGASPSSGPAGGFTSVTITGTNFVGVTAVKFGSASAKSFKVLSETSISAESEPGTGAVDITVTTPAGTSATSAADRYTYNLGPVVAWGDVALGNAADIEESFVPLEVASPSEVASVESGWLHSVAFTRGGTVSAWGSNEYGQLGNGTGENSRLPVKVCAAGVTSCDGGPYLEGVKEVSTGEYHSLALMNNGTVMAWGYNYWGQLGAGSSPMGETVSGPEQCTEHEACSKTPVPVCTVAEHPCSPAHYLKNVKEVFAGALDSFALLNDGTLMGWGVNAYSELGDVQYGGDVPTHLCTHEESPCNPSNYLKEVTAVSGGQFTTLMLMRDGTVKAMGYDLFGALGQGADAEPSGSAVPVPVCAEGEKAPCARALSGVAEVSAGQWSEHALLRNGTVVSWGGNGAGGELGNGTSTGPEICERAWNCSTTPVAVDGLSEPVVQIVGMNSSSLALTRGGDVMAWGWGGFVYPYSPLGDGNGESHDSAVHVCAPYVSECTNGPYLEGATAIAGHESEHAMAFLKGLPEVGEVTPNEGSAIGGTSVTIRGRNLGNANVTFGGQPATIIAETSKSITVQSPSHASGEVDVVVTTPYGASDANPADRFTYTPAPTSVTNVQPDSGSPAGGTQVVISGSNFYGTPEVKFGSKPATGVEVLSSSTLRATSPEGAGAVEVTVTTPVGGTSPTSSAGTFTYKSALKTVVWGHDLEVGSNNGSTPRTIIEGEEVTAVAAEYGDGVALLRNGQVKDWGVNGYGQLGTCNEQPNGSFGRPISVCGIAHATSVAAGFSFALAVEEGKVKAWGEDNYGQLGPAEHEGQYAEEPVEVQGVENAVAVAAGEYHSVALLKDGHVMQWGDGNAAPAEVAGLSEVGAIAAAGDFNLALLRDGQVMAWGNNEKGELGDGNHTSSTVPVGVKGLSNVTAIAAGKRFAMALLSNGKVDAWGSNEHEQLGTCGCGTSSDEPVELHELSGVTAIAGGSVSETGLATLISGKLDQWGWVEQVNTVHPVEKESVSNVTAADGSWNFYIAAEGPPVISNVQPNAGPPGGGTHVTISGTDLNGATSVEFGSTAATSFTVNSANSITAIAPAGAGGTVDVTVTTATGGTSATGSADQFTYRSEDAMAWGENAYGELGNGNNSNSLIPVEVSGPLSEVVQLAGGGQFGYALLSNGKIMAWGSNSKGELGNGTTTSSNVLVEVKGIEHVVEVAATSLGGIALLPGGKVKTWGNNGKGELGDGKTPTQQPKATEPVEVTGLPEEVTAIGAGAQHDLVVLKSGKVMSWGYNSFGQLGIGKGGSYSDVPVPVCASASETYPCSGQLGEASAVAGVLESSYALLKNGKVVSWGYGGNGSLGDGGVEDAHAPVPVVKVSQATAISGGADSRRAMALLANGTVMAWGEDLYGELGCRPNCEPEGTPSNVEHLSEVTAIASGGWFSLGLERNGNVMGWGENAHGELGNGTTTTAYVPTPVSNLSEATAIGADTNSGLAVGR
jgi:alpha-tubulin suppressor-like RCC1 family protein